MESRRKYVDAVKNLLISESSFPSAEFIHFFAHRLSDLNLTAQTIDGLAPIVREAFRQFIDDQIKSFSKSSQTKESGKHPRQSDHVVSDEEFESFFVVSVS